MQFLSGLDEGGPELTATQFTPGLRMMPSARTIVVGCVDPRVDPANVLGAAAGEIAAIRNVGGRITPAVLDEFAMLRKVTQAAGGDFGPGWNFVVLHHTDCGITRLLGETQMLAKFFAIDPSRLAAKEVADPRLSVRVDTAALALGTDGVRISGLVYDVFSGKIETVVRP